MQCCVSFCKNTPDDVSPSARNRITFHGFPQDVRLRAAWLRALGKQDSQPPDCAVVCSQHFLDDNIFETENGLRQICTDSIPSTVQVCTICLDTDSKLFLMSKHKLEKAYEELIGHPVCDQGNLKQTLCVQCAQKLISFSRFRDKSLRARALMMDLVEKHELITRNHIKMISRTKHQLKSNFEVKMLGPDHCDLYILEDASEDKQTESFPSLFTTSLCSEATVQEVVVKNEETCDSPTDQDMEISNEDINNADHSSDEFFASNEDLLSDNSIMLETRLMDDALCKVLESNRAVAEQVAETMALLKCESVPSKCTLCSEEFVGEHACIQHMHMHGQNGDGDADCGISQVCKPRTAVSSSHTSHLTEKKQDIQRLNDDPRPSAGEAQTALAPLSARLATNTENNVQAEQADTVQKSVQAFDINNDQLLRQSSHNKSITDIRKLTNCFVKLYDVFKLPQKRVPIQEESHRKDTRTAITGCDSQCQSVSQNENIRHTMEDNEPGTSKVKVNERNVCKTSKSEVNCSKDAKNWLTCDVCNDKFNRKSVLAKHIKSHTDIKPFACKFCQFKTKGRGNLITHVRTHTGDKPYGCELCKYKTFYKSILLSHMKTHTGEKPYSCELCEHKTARKYNLVLHMRTHTGEKPYTCDLCEYKCARKFHLVEHMRTHTSEKPYSCMLCKYKCIQKSYLVKHMRTHTGEKPYSCMLCKYKCIQKSYLASHMRIHTGEKPYSCTLCKYKCMQKSYLVSHMSTHTGEKPYSCMLCKYKCIQESYLVNHMRTHTGEKPYSCTLCKYKCIQKSYLVSHMRTHTGEKPYSCMLCKYKCSSSSNLAQHMRTHTGEKP